jgi:hypothetical protein
VLKLGIEDDAAGVVFGQSVEQGRWLCRSERWDVRWPTEVVEDGGDRFTVLDQRDETPPAAAWALQDVDGERSLEQDGPRP